MRRTTTKQTRRRKTQTQTMMWYANYNANATQSQRRRRRNAERDKYQKNSSKNSEPLLSLLDLSEHKNWGVNFVAFYRSTGCKFIRLSRHIQQTSSFVSSIPRYPRHLPSLSYSVTSHLVCRMRCVGSVCCALLAGRVSSSCLGDVIR